MRKQIVVGIVALLAAIVVITAAQGIFSFIQTSHANTTARTFASAVIAGDAKTSFNLLTPSAQKQNPLDGSWATLVENLSLVFQGQRLSTPTKVKEANFYTVLYKITGRDGQNYVLTITLDKNAHNKVSTFTSTVSTSESG